MDASIPAEPDVRNFSFCIRNGKFYYRENAIMREVSLGATSAARMRQLIELRDTTRDLIQAQLEDMPDEVITELQAKLNRQYDHYHSKFGLINSRGASLDMRDDSGYFLRAPWKTSTARAISSASRICFQSAPSGLPALPSAWKPPARRWR